MTYHHQQAMIGYEPSFDGGWYFACTSFGAEHRQNPDSIPSLWTRAVCRSCHEVQDFRLVVHRTVQSVLCLDCGYLTQNAVVKNL